MVVESTDSSARPDYKTEVINEKDNFQVVSRIPCLNDIDFRVISKWRMNTEEKCVYHKWSLIIINGRQLSIGHAFTPFGHLHSLQQHIIDNFGIEVSECDLDISSLTNTETVYLARRGELIEVFLDRATAVHWAKSIKLVKEISVDAARCALKTDRESVLRSAYAATNREFDFIQILNCFTDIAHDSKQLMEEIGARMPDISRAKQMK